MLDNNLIIIYGKAGSYKSSLGISLLNSSNKKCCYIDLEGNNNSHISINDNIKIYNDINSIDDYIKEYDIILVDYIGLARYTLEDILKLKDKVAGTNKTLILICCCACNKELINDYYDRLKEISDLMLLTDKKKLNKI